MQVHIKYRVHGLTDQPLMAGHIVELDEATAHELIRQGAAEELPTILPAVPADSDPELQARCAELEQAFKTEREHSAELENVVFSLRDENTALVKRVGSLSESLKKARAKTPPIGEG